ncbi:MAG TPA: GNAT family N-acetyltransferase [Burkholderiales bacterium]|nr:GNAT family N-acetyltransferase [Burkholderiales bacterium]
MTGSTEHPLGPEHLGGCLALSRAANWNQNEADWRLMLAIGHGWGISVDGTLAASTLVLPFERFAWISMVLVLPEQRRKGHATRLLRVALADLEKRGLTPVLDATPAGREVYRLEGFRDTWGFKRYVVRTEFDVGGNFSAHPLMQPDWKKILELDRKAFGASRERLLRDLARRLPQAALVHEKGYVLGREGREALQVGPLVARDEDTAIGLLSQALRAVKPPLYVDVADHAPRLRGWLEAHGFAFQRPFTRMVRGLAAAPGDEKLVYCVAGPELG